MAERRSEVVYFSLLASVGIYGVAAFRLAKQPGTPHLPMPMVYGLIGVALIETLLVIPFLYRMFLPPTRVAASLDERTPDSEPVRVALARLLAAQIITWAMCDAIAVYGVILVILSHDTRYFFGFAALSLVNFLFYRPSEELSRGVARAAAYAADTSATDPRT